MANPIDHGGGPPQGYTMDIDIGARAIAMLRSAGIEFAPEHLSMLSAGLPVGPERSPNGSYPDWPRWRDGTRSTLRRRLDAPVEWLLPDDDGPMTWWHSSWGDRPADQGDAVDAARAGLKRWPTLVPIYGHRFMPAAPAPDPAPVLSVHGGDIIFYGSDLLDYLHNEFVRRAR